MKQFDARLGPGEKAMRLRAVYGGWFILMLSMMTILFRDSHLVWIACSVTFGGGGLCVVLAKRVQILESSSNNFGPVFGEIQY